MPRLVFDIETTGTPFAELDPAIQEEFLRYAKTDEEREEAETRVHISPFTGEVVAIGMFNPDTNRGVMYAQTPKGGEELPDEDGRFRYEACSDERATLQRFWKDVRGYDQIVSFAGRMFDGPFLHIRSVILGIPATRDLVPYRYGKEHFDLLDQMTFFGAMRRSRVTLDIVCRAFGIESPKSHGVTGLDAPRLFAEGRYAEIARYCARDVVATAELLKRWEAHFGR